MASAQRKPVGGIRSAEITPLGGEMLRVTLTEDRSSYTEEVLSDDGIARVHHTLTLVVPRTEGTSLFAQAPSMVTNGVKAIITTAAGEVLTAGWSDRFIFEQPLRLTSFSLSTGSRAADGNEAVLRFESDDTTALQEITQYD